MTEFDLIVIGAGPAGANAALVAAEAGVKVAVVDEAPAAGGQVYRAPPDEFDVSDVAALGPDFATGQALREALARSAAERLFGHRVWMVSPGFNVDAVGPDGPITLQAPHLIVGAGTYERLMPFPNWTQPGVIGLAAATILLKCHQMLPGERTVVAGVGPLVAAVAAAIVKGGGRPAAVVDLSSPADWLKALPAMASRPDLLKRGVGWLRQVRAKGVPILCRHTVVRASGGAVVSGIDVAPVDANWRPRADGHQHFDADSLTIGHGLVPATDISRLLGADHNYVAAAGGWVPVRDPNFATNLPGLSVVGDGGGIVGAAASALQGRQAGLSVARHLGRLSATEFVDQAARLSKALRRAENFGSSMAAMMALRPGLLEAADSETVICRCEDVTRADIEAALAAGAREVNQLKSWTRCGMGPCQGRMCGEAAATLVAAHAGGRRKAGIWTARVPLRPLPMETLTGDYVYDDIPKRAPAPA